MIGQSKHTSGRKPAPVLNATLTGDADSTAFAGMRSDPPVNRVPDVRRYRLTRIARRAAWAEAETDPGPTNYYARPATIQSELL